MNKELSIVGIRSKTTTSKPTYLFSLESEDVEFLRHIKDLVQQTLYVYGVEINQVERYHDQP